MSGNADWITKGATLYNTRSDELCLVTDVWGSGYSVEGFRVRYPDGNSYDLAASDAKLFEPRRLPRPPVSVWAKPLDLEPEVAALKATAARLDEWTSGEVGNYEPEPDPLTNHPAVRYHGKGVTSAELASFTEALSSLSASRIKGTGHQQYDLGDRQKFEDMSVDELVTGLLEEAADSINYISMTAIKILAAVNAAKERLSRPETHR